tara:strand:- start:1252 stop:1710 length:459 start_codon:yes stop_codon:yes gene_type:complete
MNKTIRLIVLSLVAAFAMDGIGHPAVAEEGQGFFTARRSLGLMFLGCSAALLKKGMDFNEDADELYALYEAAETPEDADRLYARTNNRDIKSQVSWALASAFAVSGVRLILRSGTPSSALYGRPHTRAEPVTYVEPHLSSGRLGVVLKQSFF